MLCNHNVIKVEVRLCLLWILFHKMQVQTEKKASYKEILLKRIKDRQCDRCDSYLGPKRLVSCQRLQCYRSSVRLDSSLRRLIGRSGCVSTQGVFVVMRGTTRVGGDTGVKTHHRLGVLNSARTRVTFTVYNKQVRL